MQIYLISLVAFSNNRSFGMGMTLYPCITRISQMSRKRYYLRAKASGCRLLFSINRCCHWGRLVNIRLLPSSTSDNIKFLRYTLI